MGEENQVVEPQVIEVDNFSDMTIDPNESLFGEDGNVIQTVDKEKNIIYRMKGAEDPLKGLRGDEGDKDDDKDKDKNPADGNNDPVDDDKDKNKEDEDKDDPSKYANRAEYFLKKTGYDKDEIDLGEGVGVVKIADLTPEQQVEVISQEFDAIVADYEQEIADLAKREPDLKITDPMAKKVVHYLQNGGDVVKLAKEIISKDPAAQAKILTDADIVKRDLRKMYPEWSDEDIDAEFGEMNEAQVARRAKATRARMEKESPDLSSLTEEQKAAQQAQMEAARAEFDNDVKSVKEAAEAIEEIGGIKLTKDVREFLVKKVLPSSMEEDSDFIKAIDGNPKELIEFMFWRTYGKQLNEKTAKYYYEKGLEDANKEKEKLSDNPLRTYQFSGKKGEEKKKKTNPVTLDDVDFEKFINGSEF